MGTVFSKEVLQKNLKTYIMVVALVVIAIVFSILTKGVFIVPRNLSMLARQTTVTGILAIGMMFVIVAGHIDLSVGQVCGACGTLAAVLQVWNGWDTPLVIPIVIIAGAVIGAWNGFWVAYRGVPAFIITLGGLLIFQGMKLGVGKSASIAPMKDSFVFIGQAYLPIYAGWIIAIIAVAAVIFLFYNNRKSKRKYNFAIQPMRNDVLKAGVVSFLIIAAIVILNQYKGLPVPVLLLILLAVVFSYVAKNTVYGRSVYSIGGNMEAARLSGINTKYMTMIIFVISGALAALAGIVLTARLNAATAAAGDSMELDAIASCVIGGTSMAGGVGNIPGVIIGALIMASLDNGMSLINLENFWQYIVKGLVLVLAVWIDTETKAKSR